MGSVASSTSAFAQETPEPRDARRASYALEIEPHLAFGPANVYGNTGFGGGVRLGVPLAVGHIDRFPQNIALGFGGDMIHYENCYFGDRCGANYLMFPVDAQWNVYVARSVSLFGEAGVFVYKGFLDGCRAGDIGCSAPSDFGLLPTLALGVRAHLNDATAFVARVGYPTITLGFSFF
jgi:hypothetical protein